ncbi:MarR family winged helix-turn-helix transcriptional regulator [Deminuibacter soli]|uniref:MarR family transcriptional regulator n=1 Tax=Deminuibacter soli TaxID=2291815 RepID=A0A3E1NCS1_9BACT|nr:MarR family transcriptional regulator [Deminuibacter soli]RFM25627.1 MarR family transcriptional regulator [Deminuibacter soli]
MSDKQDLAIAAEIRIAVSRILRQFRKQVVNFPVSMTEQTTLALLDQHEKMLPSELAAIERITAQSMSQVLNNLHSLGYIHKEVSTEDKRKIYISLSKTGLEVLNSIRTKRNEWLANAMAKTLTAEEKKVLKQSAAILTRLAAIDL